MGEKTRAHLKKSILIGNNSSDLKKVLFYNLDFIQTKSTQSEYYSEILTELEKELCEERNLEVILHIFDKDLNKECPESSFFFFLESLDKQYNKSISSETFFHSISFIYESEITIKRIQENVLPKGSYIFENDLEKAVWQWENGRIFIDYDKTQNE